MAISAVPGAIAALLEILRTPPIDNVDVIDGPPTEDIQTQDLIVIGWSPENEQAATLTQDWNAAGARTRDETITISGSIDVWSGDTGFTAVRARAFELLGEVEQRIRATGPNPTAPTLNGSVLWAELAQGALYQSHTDQGIRAALAFTVSCHARI